MKALDKLLIAHIAAWWRDTDNQDFEEQVNATYDAYLADGGSDEHYNARWAPLRAVFAGQLRQAIRAERGTGLWYISGSVLYFEAGEQVCPECKKPHDNLFARCVSCQDAKNYRDTLVVAVQRRPL
jgi:hypothetical protein